MTFAATKWRKGRKKKITAKMTALANETKDSQATPLTKTIGRRTSKWQKGETLPVTAFPPRLSEFHLPIFHLMPDGARRFRLSPWHHPPGCRLRGPDRRAS